MCNAVCLFAGCGDTSDPNADLVETDNDEAPLIGGSVTRGFEAVGIMRRDGGAPLCGLTLVTPSLAVTGVSSEFTATVWGHYC